MESANSFYLFDLSYNLIRTMGPLSRYCAAAQPAQLDGSKENHTAPNIAARQNVAMAFPLLMSSLTIGAFGGQILYHDQFRSSEPHGDAQER
jgi:hypothetical protein